MKQIEKMSVEQLREQLKNLQDVENMISNNNRWWCHPDTNRQANIEFVHNRREMEKISSRLKELES